MLSAGGGIGVVGRLEFWRKFRRCVRGGGKGLAKGEDAAPIKIIGAEIGKFTEFDVSEVI